MLVFVIRQLAGLSVLHQNILKSIKKRFREGFKKKSWNFPIGGGGGPKIKKNSNFSKNSAFLLRMP